MYFNIDREGNIRLTMSKLNELLDDSYMRGYTGGQPQKKIVLEHSTPHNHLPLYKCRQQADEECKECLADLYF